MSSPLLNFIAHSEGADYNTAYGGSQVPDGLTLGQAIEWARAHGQKTGSSAIGRYQFLADTLQENASKMGVSLDALFTPQLQDQMANYMVNNLGYHDFVNGKISPQQFVRNLSQTWASIPAGPDNRSYYEGDKMGNSATVPWQQAISQVTNGQVPTALAGAGQSQLAGIDPRAAIGMGVFPTQRRTPTFAEAAASNPFLTAGAAILSQTGMPATAAIGKGLLVGQEIVGQHQKLEAQIDAAHSARARAPDVPANIREIRYLKQMFPNLSDAEVLSMAFAGRVAPGGEVYKNVGGQVYQTQFDQFGRPYMAPLGQQPQTQREDVLQHEQQAKTVGQNLGKAQVDLIKSTSEQYANISARESQTKQLLDEFESGRYLGHVGAVTGRLKQFFDPQTAELQMQETDAALQNLKITNLAPVSDHEQELIRQMYASAYRNPGQNIAILRKLVAIQSAKKQALQRALNRLQTEPIDKYLLHPETIHYDDFSPATVDTKGQYHPNNARQEALDILQGRTNMPGAATPDKGIYDQYIKPWLDILGNP